MSFPGSRAVIALLPAEVEPGEAQAALATALDDGEPGRAEELLDAADLAADQHEAAADLIAALRRTGPGPAELVPLDDAFGPDPRTPTTDDPTARWWGAVLPGLLRLRADAARARRQGMPAAVHDVVVGSTVSEWLGLAADDSRLAGHLLVEASALARRWGLGDVAASVLDDDGRFSPWPTVDAARAIERGDALLTPLGTPDTLGLDLDAVGLPAVLGDPAARTLAAGHYEAASVRLAGVAAPRAGAVLGLRRALLCDLDGRPDEAVVQLVGSLDGARGADRVLLLTHLVRARIRTGDLVTGRAAIVAEIVTWGSGPGSRSFALGCVTLLRAAGQDELGAGRLDPARVLLDVALEIALGLGATGTELAVLAGQAEFHARVQALGATLATVEEAYADWSAPQAAGLPGLVAWSGVGALLTRVAELAVGDSRDDTLAVLAGRVRSHAELDPGTVPGREREVAALVEERRAGLATAAGVLDVLVPLVGARLARAAGDDEGAEELIDEALRAAAAGPAPGMVLVVLAAARRRDPLREQLARFAPALDAESAARLWLEAEVPDEARNALTAAGTEEPAPASPVWWPQWEGCELRAGLALASGDLTRAATLIDAGLERFEQWFAALTSDTFRTSVLDTDRVRRLHDGAVAVGVASAEPAAVLVAADRARSLSLGALAAEALGRDGPAGAAVRRRREAEATFNGAFDAHRRAWRSRRPPARARTGAVLAAARAELDAALTASPGRPTPVPSTDPAEVAAALGPDQVLLHHTLLADELVVTTVSRERQDVVRVPVAGRHLTSLVARVQRRWRSGEAVESADAQALTAALVTPLRTVLDGHRHLVVVPDGALHTLPFAALELGGDPLLEHWTVSQLPAAALVPRLAGVPSPRIDRGAVVVGDPASRSKPALPAARVEALAVARLLGVDALTRADADEARVRAALPCGRGVVHVAAHGVLDPDAPDLTFLALAGDDELTLAELVGLDLRTDLAVLSACDSGRGEITRAGEVVGLARGTLAAGARHTLMTMWPVDDVPACLTMVGFTERLVAGEPVAEALAGAQREVRRASRAERIDRCRTLAAAVGVDPDEAVGAAAGAGRGVVRGRGVVDLPDDDRAPRAWAPFVHLGV